jgi:hypothetical protein
MTDGRGSLMTGSNTSQVLYQVLEIVVRSVPRHNRLRRYLYVLANCSVIRYNMHKFIPEDVVHSSGALPPTYQHQRFHKVVR